MDFKSRFASILNFIIFFILFCNTFGEFGYIITSGERLALRILRGIAAQFVLLSEFEALKPYYIENFKAFMFPKGRAICYFIFAIACYIKARTGYASVFIIVIIGLITLCYKSSDPNLSPYIDLYTKNDSGSNTNISNYQSVNH